MVDLLIFNGSDSFLSNFSNYYNLACLASSSKISPCKEILSEGISNSSVTMASSPYTNEKGVSLVAVRKLVL